MGKPQLRLPRWIFIAVLTAVLGIWGGQYHSNVSYSSDENENIKTDVIIKHKAIKIASINNTLIWHLPSSQEVCVKLDFASCPYPELIGRISGSALAHIDGWERRNQAILGSEIHDLTCGSYRNSWLSPDEYNLEIIVVLCNSFGLASPMLQHNNYSQWLEYDFKHICLEDPAKNKITLSSSTLTVIDGVSGMNSFLSDKKELGRWEMNNTAIHGPLSTRYQPQDCRARNASQERCLGPMNNDYVERLNFQWRDNLLLLEKLKRYQFDKSKKVCLLGASHSVHLLEGLSANSKWIQRQFVMAIRVKYPSELSFKMFRQHYTNHKCKKFIIGVGQHPASNQHEEHPYYSLKKWRDEMTQVVTNPDIFNIDSEIELILRSIHRMPLGDMVSACPPTDCRQYW